MKVRYTPRAARQLDEIYKYLKERSPTGARRVMDQIRQAEQFISEFPLAAQATEEPGIRRLPVGPYPYVIFYEPMGDKITIHHVRHAARRVMGRHR